VESPGFKNGERKREIVDTAAASGLARHAPKASRVLPRSIKKRLGGNAQS